MDAALRDKLIRAAREARQRSYSPYSGFAVGAALLTDDGTIVAGTNVENAAYSPSICAERAAVAAAVTAGHRRFEAVAIVGHATELVPPCGVCRQTLSEFAPDLLVVLANEGDAVRELRLSDLLPLHFDPALLKR
jgi:cytidine deaminase